MGGLKIRMPLKGLGLSNKLGGAAARVVTLGKLRVPHLAGSASAATRTPSGTPESSPGDALRIFSDPGIVPVVPLDIGAGISHLFEAKSAPNTSPPSAEGEVLTGHVQVMQGGGAIIRVAARAVLDFALYRPQFFTPAHLAGIIAVSANAASTWFGNRALERLATARRELFTDDVVARMRVFNEALDTQGCFQLALKALDQNYAPPPAAPVTSATPTATPWPGVRMFRRPEVPDLVFPPKPDPIK